MTTVPEAFRGVWRRERITAPGLLDTTTRVFWVQSSSWYGDIRVPADSPRRTGDVQAYADGELVALARSEGFAGQLTVTPERCVWRRDLDYQPPAPTPDEGAWRFADRDTLVEDGVHSDYQEIWVREPQSSGLFAAFSPDDGPGLLVLAGDHFFQVEPGPASPPADPAFPPPALPAQVAAACQAGRRALAELWLAMPICYGRIGEGWRISLSTTPWREGKPLWAAPPAYDDGAARFVEASGRIWSRLEVDGDEAALARAFAAAAR